MDHCELVKKSINIRNVWVDSWMDIACGVLSQTKINKHNLTGHVSGGECDQYLLWL